MVFDVSLEMQSDSKNYVDVQDDEITEPMHTTKSACAWHLENLRFKVIPGFCIARSYCARFLRH